METLPCPSCVVAGGAACPGGMNQGTKQPLSGSGSPVISGFCVGPEPRKPAISAPQLGLQLTSRSVTWDSVSAFIPKCKTRRPFSSYCDKSVTAFSSLQSFQGSQGRAYLFNSV